MLVEDFGVVAARVDLCDTGVTGAGWAVAATVCGDPLWCSGVEPPHPATASETAMMRTATALDISAWVSFFLDRW